MIQQAKRLSGDAIENTSRRRGRPVSAHHPSHETQTKKEGPLLLTISGRWPAIVITTNSTSSLEVNDDQTDD